MRPSALLTAVVLVVVVASLWYVQAPPRSADSYRERASASAETIRSQVQTARLTVRALRAGEATHPTASVIFREVEQDADKAAARFAAYDPPRGTSRLRSELTKLGDAVTSALAELRIAAARGDWGVLSRSAAPLPELSLRLEKLAREAGE